MKINTRSQMVIFENLCRDILLMNNWIVDFGDFGGGIDLLGLNTKTGERVAFEIKHSRNSTYPVSQLTIAAKQLLLISEQTDADKAILIVANDIKLGIKKALRKNMESNL